MKGFRLMLLRRNEGSLVWAGLSKGKRDWMYLSVSTRVKAFSLFCFVFKENCPKM